MRDGEKNARNYQSQRSTESSCRKDEQWRVRSRNLWISAIPDGQPMESHLKLMRIPHMSDDGDVVAVHNGIIENYQELKDKLTT